jgi:hypothetical protein
VDEREAKATGEEERAAWYQACGGQPNGACACSGCRHAANCACRCRECAINHVRARALRDAADSIESSQSIEQGIKAWLHARADDIVFGPASER